MRQWATTCEIDMLSVRLIAIILLVGIGTPATMVFGLPQWGNVQSHFSAPQMETQALPNATIRSLPLGNATHTYYKGSGWTLSVFVSGTNPAKLNGTVTDPIGKAHAMGVAILSNGVTELSFQAGSSDAAGNYAVTIYFVKGPNSSNLTLWGEETPPTNIAPIASPST
jgi:hypothetical protein